MAINYEQLMAMKKLGQKCSYSDRDVMLYALAIGMGADPMDERELAFVNEVTVIARPLEVVPSFASVAAGFAEPGKFNLNSIALDGERDITFHSTLPPAAHITADSSVLRSMTKQGQRDGHPLPNDAEGQPRRTAGNPYDFVLCPSGRRFWRPVPRSAQATPHAESSSRSDHQHSHAPRSGADLPALRRPPPAAFRSGVRQAIRLSETNPSRLVHLRNHLPWNFADLCRL